MTDFTADFRISRWRAWAPGVKTMADWSAWLAGRLPPAPDDEPDVSYLPSLLRRRLDRPGRMALATAWPCAEGLESVQLVLASRHGALARTMTMLSELERDEPLSPALFSLSVHNSTAGLFSIARGDRGAATAMAAGRDSLVLALLEGANMLQDGAPNVLVTYSDDVAPAPYNTRLDDSAALPFAVSLLLNSAKASDESRCRLGRAVGTTTQEAPEAALIRFLTGAATPVTLGVRQCWRLEGAAC